MAYALAPSYAYGTDLLDLCYTTPPPANMTMSTCTTGTNMRHYRFLLIIGSMLQGAGATPLHTLGMSFLDENLPVRYTSCFLGTYSAMAVLGPALGFLVSGYFLSVFVDLKDVSSIGLTSQSSMWIGAWWVGFLVAAVMGAIVSVPMAAFPKHLPSFHQCQMVRRLHVCSKGADEDTAYGQYVSDIPRAILALLRNIPFVMLTLASASEAMVGTAVAAFSVKFFEAEFSMTPSKTAAALGCILIPAGIGGTVMGGALVSKMELPIRTILKMCCAMSIIRWLCMWVFALHCPNPTFFRGEVRSSNRTVDFTSECNENCRCRAELLDPICSVENVVYASPCFAGCLEREVIPNPYDGTWEMQVYKNCSCVPIPPGAPSNASAYDFEATRLKCPTDCDLLVIYMVVIFICVFFSFFNSGPIITVMMRCVQEKERAVGLAVKWVTIRVVGNIPAPLLLGSVIDGSCLLWQEVCFQRGACLLYNNELLALSMLEFLVPAKTCSILLYYGALTALRSHQGIE
uniref:Solute carrier organic anion transporter family member n=1 Tax=Amblyomma americanum TaxID=6943 RepID=A0A0E9Y283_AMBAM